jgi:hypothetical protein
MESKSKLNYGSVWQQASANVLAILESKLSEGEKLEKVMELGYFSQFTSYASLEFNESIFEWLRKYLFSKYKFDIDSLPDDLVELDIVPKKTLVSYSDRKLTPDLLRNVGYALQIRRTLSKSIDKANVLEIGSGYGGLARVIKSFNPGVHYWLTDISESLQCAEIYLKKTFPNAKIVWQNEGISEDEQMADFYLVRLEDAVRVLSGIKFQLAINIWSFGEMPNEFIDQWLKLIQQKCKVEWFFTINSFMAPVTIDSISRKNVGDWLFRLDSHWNIEYFEIDPEIHRCPLIKNFPKGIGILAQRVIDQNNLFKIRKESSNNAKKILLEDWVGVASEEKSIETPDRPERNITHSINEFDINTISSSRLRAITDYVGHFNIESCMKGPIFLLWDDYRLNNNQLSGALLVCYMAMVGKSELNRRCSKEELLLLDQLNKIGLHDEYVAFSLPDTNIDILEEGDSFNAQIACDQAIKYKKVGELELAESLWIKVAINNPEHGDCWYQLAVLRNDEGDTASAAIFASHSVYLGCKNYANAADEMRKLFLKNNSVLYKIKYLLVRYKSKNSERRMKSCAEILSYRDCGVNYFNGNNVHALEKLAQKYCEYGNESMAKALGCATVFLREKAKKFLP